MISGFTIIRNGVKYDFPFLESLKSLLPVCDEVVVNVGKSEDDTLGAIVRLKSELSQAESEKIIIIETEWPLNDQNKRQGGQILADQTNLALNACRGNWCLYLQADEVLHEDDYPIIRHDVARADADRRVEAVVFNYVHFYGTYDVVQTSRSSYRREIRAVRNGIGIHSTGDAQSFRGKSGQKLGALLSAARVFHYGWARPQELMKQKTAFMDTLYHPDATAQLPATGDNYLYKRIVGLRPFCGTHPSFMAERVKNAPHFDFSEAPRVFQFNDLWKVFSGCIEKLTGCRLFEYKNYRIL